MSLTLNPREYCRLPRDLQREVNEWCLLHGINPVSVALIEVGEETARFTVATDSWEHERVVVPLKAPAPWTIGPA